MCLIFSFPGSERLAKKIASKLGLKLGEAEIRHFPDGETYIRIDSDIKDKELVLITSLDHPDTKAMGIMFFANLAKELGAKTITLVSPYLGYMRQDKKFKEGEVITSRIFAKFLSEQVNSLITVDPHLHRYKSLSEIYSIPTTVLHATTTIADWAKTNIAKPLFIGPDEESEQWVKKVAELSDAPYIVLKKIRHGDKNVEVSLPNVDKYRKHTPVLVDDIISTARTMIETVEHLNKAGMKAPICIGVHAIFAGDAYQNLQNSGVGRVVTCNCIEHETNAIDLSEIIAKELKVRFNHASCY